MAIRLLQLAYSPYAAKVRKCLELKKLDHELVEVPYMDRREVMRLTGQVVVPVLVDGDHIVWDSPRITTHLDERYPVSLRPSAAAVVFEQWADSTLEDVAFRIASPMVEPRIAEQSGGRADAPGMYRYIKERKFGAGCIDLWKRTTPELTAKLRSICAPLARTLESQPFLLGDAPTLADAAVWGNFYMLEWASPGWTARELPELAAWYARLS
jgi:glutathione S-transferase